jgi:NAD(P)-dependent dehydrogenase (short-subunit alcohol dehydrogenase family)
MNKGWSINDAPELHGRRAVVTGANTGLGFETAKALAARGCHTILACRDADKAQAAKQSIVREYPDARIDVQILDTGSLASVRRFAQSLGEDYASVDILVNNAGIMTTPYFQTEDGFEGQLAVNYLGHFLLTGLLLPLLEAAPAGRVVTLYSLAHRMGGIQFDDMHFSRGYDPGKSYCQSKMACLMFALELDRKLKQAGSRTRSIAAHPGMSQSGLFRHLARPLRIVSKAVGVFLFQSTEQGALPALHAALSDELKGGEAIGPGGAGQRKGNPRIVDIEESARCEADRERLWHLSEDMVGFSYKL